MNNTISFMSANYVARLTGYRMTGGWGQGDRATSEHFRPVETFRGRFEELLKDVTGLGFRAMDLWTAHISPQWVEERHLAVARELLDEFGVTVPSMAGWFGSNREQFEATCRIARSLDIPVLGGSTSLLDKDRDWLVETLAKNDLKLGVENHPEKTPQELVARTGDDGGGRIGFTVDTGWFGTQGFDAAQALAELSDRLFNVHLKDVRAEGAHETCRFGEGVVPLRRCVETLARLGFDGAISIEHEPEFFDPSEDCRASRELLEEWMREMREVAR